jgi:hypothetical protein
MRANRVVGANVARAGTGSCPFPTMNFRNLAQDEAAALVHDLLTRRSERAAHDLQAFQQALAVAMQQLETAVGPAALAASSESDADLARMVERLAEAAEGDKQAAIDDAEKQARAALDAVRADLKAQSDLAAEIEASLKTAKDDAESLREELQRVTAQVAALTAERASLLEAAARVEAGRVEAEKAHKNEAAARNRAEHELQTVQELLATTRAQSSAISHQLDVEAAERARLAVALTASEAHLKTLEEQRHSMDADANVSAARLTWLEGAWADSERVHKELEARAEAAIASEAALKAQAADAERQLLDARAELERATEARSKAERTLEQMKAEGKSGRSDQGASVRQHAVTFLSRSLDRLRACSDTLADAFSAEEVLSALVTVFSTEFARVALFSVKRNRLEGIRQVGFEGQPDMSQLLVPRSLDSLLTRAAVSGRVEVLASGELGDATGSPFGGTAGSVWAIPIEVDGVAVAVIYADDADKAHTEIGNLEVRTKFADLLSRYASSALARLPAAAPEAPNLNEYARRLIGEVESMYDADAGMGRKKDELRARLRENVEYARRTYAERNGSQDESASFIEDELAIAAKAGTDFAKELAKLLKAKETPAAADSPKRRAEGR